MPSYHIDIACFVADVERKWIHNLLTRVALNGAEGSGHGTVRRLTLDAVRQIALTRRLVQDLGLTLERATELAGQLLEANGVVSLSSGLSLSLDVAAFTAEVDRRLNEGVESVVLARRGRPPTPPTGARLR